MKKNIPRIKQILYLLIFTFACLGKLTAQSKVVVFELTVPSDLKVNNNYKNVEFIDSRTFNEYLGFVQTSLFNIYTFVVDKPILSEQIKKIFSELTSKTIGNKTLVFQLRRLYFSEMSKNTGEMGYCHIRYNLYSRV